MNPKHIGFLHPGAMGISLAATARNLGHIAYWASEGRSAATRARADKHQLTEVRSIEELCENCTVIISVCPPHAAQEMAQKVLAFPFEGVYADVNAISPQHVRQIAAAMREEGVPFVDGGLIGPPVWQTNSTWLYLSGREAGTVAECFKGGPLAVEIIGDDIGKASALKMCFAANTKGTTALLCAILAAAEKMGVRQELENQWSQNGSDFAQKAITRVSNVTAKAWRFSGEMQEIASTFEAAGLPGGFHLAAADIYERIAMFKDAEPIPEVEDILVALLNPDK